MIRKRPAKVAPNPYLTSASPDDLGPANRIAYDRVIGELPLGEDLLITELRPPPSFVGHTLADLKLPQRYNVTVVAVRQQGSGGVVLPTPNEILKADDILIIVSREEAVGRLMEQS